MLMHVLTDLIIVAVLVLIGTAAISTVALAHKPLFEDRDTTGLEDAILIPDPDVSRAVYGFLDSESDVDYYYFDIHQPLRLYTSLLVPKNDVYAEFRPVYVIIGPGIDGMPEGLPFNVPDGMGAMVIESPDGDREEFYEPFTATTYYRGVPKHTPVSVRGRYYVAVYDRDGKMGDYVLAVGEKEQFGLSDLPGVIAAVMRIRSGGVDHSQMVSREE